MYTLEYLLSEELNDTKTEINGRWVSCRPLNSKYRSLITKIQEVWFVFTGKADAFTWPENQ